MIPRHLRGKLTSAEIAVYVALTWRSSAEGSCWPSHPKLAEEAGLSVSTVQRALRSLRDKGLVSWTSRKIEGRGQISNVYRVEVYAPPVTLTGGPPVTLTAPPGHTDRTPPVTLTDEVDTVEVNPKKKTQPRKRGTVMKAGTAPSPEMMQWARKHTPDVGTADWESFVDYWVSVGKPKVDWYATWRNRAREVQKRYDEKKPKAAAPISYEKPKLVIFDKDEYSLEEVMDMGLNETEAREALGL